MTTQPTFEKELYGVFSPREGEQFNYEDIEKARNRALKEIENEINSGIKGYNRMDMGQRATGLEEAKEVIRRHFGWPHNQ